MIEPLLEAERALEVGLIDKADRLYRTVAERDPRNSIAIVGMARVRLERGDDVGALRMGRRALAIDPENAAAQRLVARLEEVIRTRGDEVPTGMADLSELGVEAGKAEPSRPPTEPEPEPASASELVATAPEPAAPPEAASPPPASTEPEPVSIGPAPPGSAPVPAAPPEPHRSHTPARPVPRSGRSLLDRLLRRA